MHPDSVLDRCFPEALGAIVTGSVARGEDTATSDLDLLVFLTGPPAPMRRTDRVDGQLVELFVHTEASFHTFVSREAAQRRSPLLHMCAHGTLVRDHGQSVSRLQQRTRDLWAAGPAPLSTTELEDRRYRLTALLDDLGDESDIVAVAALAASAFLDVADLALALRRRWSGRGRWLTRRLRDADDQLAAGLATALRDALDGDPSGLLRHGRDELDRAGGRLDNGYLRHAKPPPA